MPGMRTLARSVGLLVLLMLQGSLLAGPRVAVLGLHVDGAASSPAQLARAQQVNDALQAAIRQSSGFTLLSDDAIVQNFTPRAKEIQEAVFLLPGRALLQEARVYAEQAQFDKALARLEQAEAALLFYSEHLTSNQELIDIQLSLAQLYSARGDISSMESRLRRLVMLAPERPLDPLRSTPLMQETHAQLAAELRLKTADLELVSEPAGAKVYINGAFRGTTPTEVAGLPQGRHFVRLEGDSGRTFYQEVNLTTPGVVQVGGVLGLPNLYSASRPPPAPPEAVARIYDAYRVLGRKAEADFVVLGHLKSDGLEVQLLRVADGQQSPLYEAPVAGDLSNLSSSMRNLVLQLEALVSPAGTLVRTTTYPLISDPSSNGLMGRFLFPGIATVSGPTSKTPSGNVASPTSRAPASGAVSKPFYQKPLFWAIVGGVALSAAGGTAAAVMVGDQAPSGMGKIVFAF